MAVCRITGIIQDASGAGYPGAEVKLIPKPRNGAADLRGGIGLAVETVTTSGAVSTSGTAVIAGAATTAVVAVGAQYAGLTVEAALTAPSAGSGATSVAGVVASDGNLTLTLDAAPGAGEQVSVAYTIGAGDFAVTAVQGFSYQLRIEALGYEFDFQAPALAQVRFDLLDLVPRLETVTAVENAAEEVVLSFTVAVDDVNNVRERFDQVTLEQSDTVDFTGAYSLIYTWTLRSEVDTYEFALQDGDRTRYYRARFVNSANGDTGPYTAPRLGDAEAFNSVYTVDELKDIWLFGVNLTDSEGTPYPDRLFEFYIEAAIDWLESQLNIVINPTDIVDEQHDHYGQDYGRWGYFQLRKYPVQRIDAVTFQYPSQQAKVEINKQWIVLVEEGSGGVIQIVPGQGSIADVLFLPGSLLPLWSGATGRVPGIWKMSYRAGFEPGKIPPLLKEIIGLKAAIGVLNIAGDLIAGAGIATLSMSVPGLSQNVGTTSSATNSGYGARIIQYNDQVEEKIRLARDFWRGISMVVV